MDLGTIVFFLGTLALVGFVCLNAYLGAQLLRHTRLEANPLLHPAEGLARLAFIAACAFLGWLSGLPPEQLGWTLTNLGGEVAWGLLAGGVLAAANHWSTRWAVRRFGPGIYSPAFLRAMLPGDRRQWVLVALALFPAAFAEEVLFRGLAIGGLSVFVPPLLLAVLFAGLFGLAHLPQGRLGVVGAATMGFALSLFFLWRWNLIACTVAHYVVNLAQLGRAKQDLRWLEEVETRKSPK